MELIPLAARYPSPILVMSSQRLTTPSIDENEPVVASSNVNGHDADARDRFSERRQQGTSVVPVVPRNEDGM